MSDAWYKLKKEAISELEQRLGERLKVTSEDIHEIADQWIPVYTVDLLNLALSNFYFVTEEPEL